MDLTSTTGYYLGQQVEVTNEFNDKGYVRCFWQKGKSFWHWPTQLFTTPWGSELVLEQIPFDHQLGECPPGYHRVDADPSMGGSQCVIGNRGENARMVEIHDVD